MFGYPPRKNDLTRTKWNEFSIVPKGANGKTFLIFKGVDGMGLEDDILRAIMGTPLDKEAQIDGILKEHKIEGDAATVLKGIVKLTKAYEDLLPKDTPSIIAKCAGYPAPAPAPAAGQGEKKKVDEEGKDGKPVYGYPIKKSADGGFDLTGVPPELQPIVKQLWDGEEKIQKLTDEKVTKELEEVITKELPGLPVGSDFAQVLKGLREKAPDEYEKLMPVMKAASKGISKSDLFKSHGRSGVGPSGSTYDKIRAAARGLVQKSAGGLSEDEAICKIMEDPAYDDLVSQYDAEQSGNSRTIAGVE